jgi:hypothetical protein
MAEPLPDRIIRAIESANTLYHRLVIVVAPSGAGKTAALHQVAQQIGATRVNLNLELSRRLKDLTERQRPLHIPTLLDEILSAAPGEVVLLDNIEILFDVALKQDPLHRLQALSRNRIIVVAWNGTVTRDDRGHASLTYAAPGHPEYRRYPATNLVLVEPSAST